MSHWRDRQNPDLEPGKFTTILGNLAPWVFWALLFGSIIAGAFLNG